MKHWTIRWRIIASFGVMLALIIIMTALQYNRLIAIETEETEVESLALSRLLRATAIRAWADSLLVTQQFVFEPEEAGRRRLEGSLEHSRAALETAVSAVQLTV
jgi:methyl-accepting chemotaxis protein WspA